MMAEYSRAALTALALLSISACGGGGGGGSSNAATSAPVNMAPTARISLISAGTTAPLTVTADASASSDADGQIVSYAWDFAGTPAIGSQAQFTFNDPGDFTVTLTVTDEDGATGSTTQNISADTPIATSSISGVVQILNSTAVDLDVNDRFTVPQSNNSFDEAQPLPSTVTLGGFVNLPGNGEPLGNLFASGDPGDFYEISLNGGEVIVLNLAEASADIDLRLWDDQRNIVDASLSATSNETLVVPAPGRYYIEAFPFRGASNNLIYVGQDPSGQSAQSNGHRLSDDFIPGELLVKHKPAFFNRSTPTQSNSKNTNKNVVLNNARSLEVRYQEPSDLSGPGLYTLPQQTLRAAAKTNSSTKPSPDAGTFPLPQGASASAAQQAKLATLVTLKQTQQSDLVSYAELNRMAQRHADPNDTFVGSQWHYQAINLPVAWDTTMGSADVIVAVVDSGVLLNHPDLSNKLVDGYDFISNSGRALDGDGLDPDPDDPGDREFGGSSSFHGTHVAGTVGADTDNGFGVAGAGWDTQIMPLRVLGQGGGSTFDIVQAVRFAAGLSNNSNTLPARPADIINLSLGSSFSSQSEQDAFTAASQAGAIIIASAGNDASSLPSYPAAYDNVISVSATTITNDTASYSNFGPSVDIAAPGGTGISDLNGDGIADGVISAMGDDSGSGPITFTYASLVGTSMAAPHVSGVAALMKAIFPALTPTQFNAALLAGDITDDLGPLGRDDRYGFGLINAQKAVIAAAQLANGQGSNPGPIVSASASTLNFGSFLDQLNVSLQNIGTGTVTVNNASATESWVSITSPASNDGLGEYEIQVDRSNLSDGAYQAQLNFETSAGNIRVGILMQVSSADLFANAGLFYILVVDENNQPVIPAQQVLPVEGEYRYQVNGIPAGQYRVFAGSDADDDAVLCDAGEACGAFPTLDAPSVIAINADVTNLDFEAGFRINLTTNALRTGTNTVNTESSQDEAEATTITFDKAIQTQTQ